MAGKDESLAIGIDLGTTYCVIAVSVNGKVEIIHNREQSTRLTPSYVTYGPNAKESYGTVSKEQSYKYVENAIYDAKRMIGRSWDDPVLQKDIEAWPYEVVNVKGVPKIKIDKKTIYPQEVSATLLAKLCRLAEKHLSKTPGSIHKAVITVPAYFNEGQRRATMEAGQAAGLEVLSILNEPTAAAIAYKFERHISTTKTVLVYDLGGGTFDVSIAKVGEKDVEILGVDGDTHLGGQDFDQLLVQYCWKKFQTEEKLQLGPKDDLRKPMTRLKLQCEKAKIVLSSGEATMVDVQAIYQGKHLSVDVTRPTFEELLKPLVEKTIEVVERAIKGANGIKSKADIQEVILIGGSTRIPLVTKMLEQYFPGTKINVAIDPDEAVAYGAAVQADILNKAGAGATKEFEVHDVCPLSLGIKTKLDTFDCLIPKNSTIPCSKSQTYVTVFDNQAQIKITIFQGENEKCSKNEKLGEFILKIPPGPAKKEKIDVVMEINSNGVLVVSAKLLSGGASKSIEVVDDRIKMDPDTIERLIEELKV